MWRVQSILYKDWDLLSRRQSDSEMFQKASCTKLIFLGILIEYFALGFAPARRHHWWRRDQADLAKIRNQ